MYNESIIFIFFVIFFGAAVLCTVAIYTRQSLLVAYILLGFLLGPWGLKLIQNPQLVDEVGDIGIIFLLFLLGLQLQPKNLLLLLRKTVLLTVVSSIIFAVIGYGVGITFHYTQLESMVIGVAMMFSSTIIGLKLLPTTILHHRHIGEVMISILLLQDLLAIVVLLLFATQGVGWQQISILFVSLPLIVIGSILFVHLILLKLLQKFDMVQEYVWIVAIAWCLLLVELAHLAGLSTEIGAFIAGVSLAENPISRYIAESLKPMRDLFLVIFFFSVGAHFDPHYFISVIEPALILAACALFLKPLIYRFLLVREGESKHVSWEVGMRLGQASEFSLLIAYIVVSNPSISLKTSFLIQAATIVTFIASSYWVVFKYPTPLATSAKLRQD